MIADIRQFLQSRPFEPFVIVTSSGNRYRIPRADHATINPQGSRVVVWFDDESGVIISGLHIAAVEREGHRILRLLNEARQPTPGDRLAASQRLLTGRGCAHRYDNLSS